MTERIGWDCRVLTAAIMVALLLGAFPGPASVEAHSFGLDDLPLMPITPAVPPGVLGGWGAENPYGFALGAVPLTPSPSLAAFGGSLGDGAIFSRGAGPPILQHPGPNGFWVDSLSRNHVDEQEIIRLDFSVDRITTGAAGTAVAGQFGLGQAPGDIFTSTTTYRTPGAFAGTLVPVFGTYAGPLPSIVGGAPGNVMTSDESTFGLLTSGGIVGPAAAVAAPTPGSHDNVDSFDQAIFDSDGDGAFNRTGYFTVYPDEAVAVGVSSADIFAVAAGDPGAISVPYAPALSMGLDLAGPIGSDSIDALIMYDSANLPISTGDPAGGAPGMVDPVADYALFSLAPGSATLAALAAAGILVGAQDVFFTDFTGLFALYAPAASLGLSPTPPGFPFQTGNIDALDVIPEPAGVSLLLFGMIAGLGRFRRSWAR